MLNNSDINASLLAKIRKVRLLAFDVDGVLTDGRLYYGPEGECMKVFHARDGFGMRRVENLGYTVAIITARQTEFVSRRAADLGITHVYQNVREKQPCFESLYKELGLTSEETAYMGDDEIDLPVLKMVGFAACPQDAFPLVKEHCHWISNYNGGLGAAREFCDLFARIAQS